MYMSQVETKFTRPIRNQDGDQPVLQELSVFSQKVRAVGIQRNYKLSPALRKKAHWYVLINYKEIDVYRK